MDPSLTVTGNTARSAASEWVTRLVVVLEAERPEPRSVLLSNELVIGRRGHVEGEGGLSDPSVSRRHAQLVDTDDGWQIVDLGSRNGTRVNRASVEDTPILLEDGDVIRFGDALAVFRQVEVNRFDELQPEEPPLLGISFEAQRVRGQARAVGPSPAPVLILGETGVGKELVARTIHRESGRSGEFVAVNCGALSTHLIESELFGHVAGAFTGAKGHHEGLFRAADRGTLFLDEVGELPLDLQPKLLRALAEGEIRPVGATNPVHVDVRVVAATNRDLGTAVEAGEFRRDLHARLAAWQIAVPPLRRRREDIPGLIGLFAQEHAPAGVEPDALEALLVYEWPANVRELENIVRVAAFRARGGLIGESLLPSALLEDATMPAGLPMNVVKKRGVTAVEPTRDELVGALERLGGHIGRVAASFGQHRRTIYRWLERHEIDPAQYRGVSESALREALEKTSGNVQQTASVLSIDRKTVYRLARRFGVDLDAYR